MKKILFTEHLDAVGTRYSIDEAGNLVVHGSVDLECVDTDIPSNTTIEGDLSLSYSLVRNIGDFVSVTGSMAMFESLVENPPEHLTVGRDLDAGDSLLQGISSTTVVGGTLNIRGTRITTLPEGLQVGDKVLIHAHNKDKYTIPASVRTLAYI